MTSLKLQNVQKPILDHVHLWVYMGHMQKGNMGGNMQSHVEVCIFRTKGGLFYDPVDNKAFMETHVLFFESNYMNNYYKSCCTRVCTSV